jgi:hypothetical protein
MVGSGYRSESAGDQQTGLDDGEGENEDLLESNDSEGADNKAGVYTNIQSNCTSYLIII